MQRASVCSESELNSSACSLPTGHKAAGCSAFPLVLSKNADRTLLHIPARRTTDFAMLTFYHSKEALFSYQCGREVCSKRGIGKCHCFSASSASALCCSQFSFLGYKCLGVTRSQLNCTTPTAHPLFPCYLSKRARSVQPSTNWAWAMAASVMCWWTRINELWPGWMWAPALVSSLTLLRAMDCGTLIHFFFLPSDRCFQDFGTCFINLNGMYSSFLPMGCDGHSGLSLGFTSWRPGSNLLISKGRCKKERGQTLKQPVVRGNKGKRM